MVLDAPPEVLEMERTPREMQSTQCVELAWLPYVQIPSMKRVPFDYTGVYTST